MRNDSQRKKRILITGDNVESANANCLHLLAEAFSSKDYEVVLLLKGFSENIEIYHDYTVITVKDRLYIRLLREIETGSISDSIKKYLVILIQTMARLKSTLHIFEWPFSSFTYRYYVKNKVLKAYKQFRPDIVLSSFNPAEMIYASKYLPNDVHSSFVLFLDGLLNGNKPRLLSESRKREKAIKLESSVINASDGAIMMSSSRGIYESIKNSINYFPKITFLDIPFFNPVSYKKEPRKYFPENEPVILYVGSLTKNVRDPRYFLSFADCLTTETGTHIYFAGPCDYYEVQDASLRNEHIHYLGKIPHDQAVEYIKEADFLLNIGNLNSSLVPSKIFEYMSYEKPVISVITSEEDTSIKFLMDYPDYLIIDEREKAEISLEKLTNYIRSSHKPILVEEIKDLYYKNTPFAYINYIEQEVAKKSKSEPDSIESSAGKN